MKAMAPAATTSGATNGARRRKTSAPAVTRAIAERRVRLSSRFVQMSTWVTTTPTRATASNTYCLAHARGCRVTHKRYSTRRRNGVLRSDDPAIVLSDGCAGLGSPVLLAIDQGTTGTTCLVVDESLRTLGRGYQELRQHFPAPGLVEHDADEIWQTVVDAAAAAPRRRGRGRRRARLRSGSRTSARRRSSGTGGAVRRSGARSCGRTGGPPRAAPSCPSS